MRKDLTNLLINKQNRIHKVKKGYPSQKEGRDGDMVIRRISGKGLFLFYKFGNTWYGTRMVKTNFLKNPRDEKRIVPVSGPPKYDGELTRKDKFLKLPAGSTSSVSTELGTFGYYNVGTNSIFNFMGSTLAINSTSNTDGTPAVIGLIAETGSDAYISILDGATAKWKIGYDQSDSGNLIWSTHTDFATNTKMKLGHAGDSANAVLSLLYNATDYATLTTAANGATTIATVDSDGTAGHINLDADGDVKLDPASGKINIAMSDKLYFDGGTETYIVEEFNSGAGDIFSFYSGGDKMLSLDEANDKIIMGATNWVAGTVSGGTVTEFSAANSAYAGMILGYTRLQGDLTNANAYEIQDTMTVEDSTHQITFKTPPSEKVEIETTCLIDVSSTDTEVNIGLSDNATYNSIGEQFEYDTQGIIYSDDELDDHIVVCKFVLEAAQLASVGSSNTFYIGFSTSGSTKTAYLRYGVRATHNAGNHPFIIKATALPATIYDGT